MRKVFKYEFPLDDHFVLDLPLGAQPLSVAIQGDKACMWVLVDVAESLIEPRRFRCAGTGHPLKDNVGRHVGTFQMAYGQLIWHIFEEG